MLFWLRRRRETAERIGAEADALIGELGVKAYAEARRREYESSGDAIALWRLLTRPASVSGSIPEARWP